MKSLKRFGNSSFLLAARILSMLIAVSLTICVFTSCDKDENTSSQPVGEKLSTEIYDFESSYDGGNKGYVAAKDGKYGVLDKNGEVVIDYTFERIYSDYSENLLMAQSDQQNVYIDMKGNIVLKTNAAAIDEFFSSVAACAFYNEEDQTYEYGYVSLETGDVINSEVLYSAKAFSEGYGVCCVKETGLYGYIKPDGTYFIEPKYQNAGSFRNGYAPVYIDGKWGYINTKGEMAIEPQYDNVGFFNEDGYAKVCVGEDWGAIDTTGKFIVEPAYEEFNDFKEGYSVVFNGEAYGVVDINGTVVLNFEYDNIYEYNDGLFAVCKDRLWGFADADGNIVIDCQYYFVSQFSEGLAGVQLKSDSLCGYIDKTGKTVIEPQFAAIGYFHNGQAVVTSAEEENLSGVIDTSGNYVIKPEYTEIIEII